MPIVVKNVEWYQTDDQIIIKIPKTNASARNADILITETYVKVNFKPYLYETILAHEICPDASVCKILENCIKFVLRKKTAIRWTDLNWSSQSIRSGEGVKLKTEIIDGYQQSLAAKTKDKQRAKENDKKANIEKEMEREHKIRDKVNRIYDQVQEIENKRWPTITSNAETCVVRVGKPKRENSPETPSIRSGGTINVSFTARRFVTPQRESQEFAEREWCLKQNQVKKDFGFIDDDLSAEERDPKWLLAKGREFYKKRNYLAAISAFTAGINVAECPAALLLHRAMAHFKLENYSRCVSCVTAFSVGNMMKNISNYISGNRYISSL